MLNSFYVDMDVYAIGALTAEVADILILGFGTLDMIGLLGHGQHSSQLLGLVMHSDGLTFHSVFVLLDEGFPS